MCKDIKKFGFVCLHHSPNGQVSANHELRVMSFNRGCTKPFLKKFCIFFYQTKKIVYG